ncbi:MAG TPA: FAD-dependent thymidylate synthase, partial [Spirochaetota bacterium]|nr:FAD-dependent thymidylate synthase [Spirochaetota bacterium]
DPKPINDLREDARNEIDKTRKSNKTIIFDMGHASIAEHAVFNFDIINISRYLSEFIQKSRLVSFTEKSQRYIKIGRDNYFPAEFESDQSFLNRYNRLVDEIFSTYNIIHDALIPYFTGKFSNITRENKSYRDVINLAKEDARYVLPLSALTQMGMTINARNLEKLIKKLYSSDLPEFHLLAKKLFESVNSYAPSLIKYIEPTPYDVKTYPNLKEFFNGATYAKPRKEVELINFDKTIEDKIVASLLLKVSDISYKQALYYVKKLTAEEKIKIIDISTEGLSKHDSLLREYEMGFLEFGILISATAFAQLKRHRMSTIIDGEYSPKLGVTVPQSIVEVGKKKLFLEIIEKTNELYYYAKNSWGNASNYLLTNSHRKNIILKCNFRELTHISRLRSDSHSQWDVRNISDKMSALAKTKLPIIARLLGGKDSFGG